jgi:hypothetical protein
MNMEIAAITEQYFNFDLDFVPSLNMKELSRLDVWTAKSSCSGAEVWCSENIYFPSSYRMSGCRSSSRHNKFVKYFGCYCTTSDMVCVDSCIARVAGLELRTVPNVTGE